MITCQINFLGLVNSLPISRDLFLCSAPCLSARSQPLQAQYDLRFRSLTWRSYCVHVLVFTSLKGRPRPYCVLEVRFFCSLLPHQSHSISAILLRRLAQQRRRCLRFLLREVAEGRFVPLTLRSLYPMAMATQFSWRSW